MSDNSGDRKFFEGVAEIADKIADSHGTDCPLNGSFRRVAHAARECATESGPAQVATPAYRSNWETIFGKHVDAGQA